MVQAVGARGQDVRAKLAAMTPQSRALAASNREVLNMGSAANLEMPHPVLMAASEGPFLIDVDGNRYIDTMLGFGAHVLGHRHPRVEAAVAEQLAKGWHFGIHNPLQEPLARLVTEAAPAMERVIFCNSGTEATMYAIRVARAFTGKPKVAIFDGAYHGAHDTGMIMARPDSPRLEPVAIPLGAGVPEGVRQDRILLPYRERAAFDVIRAHKNDLALVMIEPVQSSNPHLDDDSAAFLRELEAVCRDCGVLFLLDEVITGFRLAFGGAQERIGLKPDLATYAKALGGGFPIGAVAGRADIMALFQGPASGDPRGIFSGGTFSGNIVTMAAGLALVSELKVRRTEAYPYIDTATARLAQRINGYAEAQQMPVQMLTGGSLFQIYFQREPIRSSRDVALTKAAAERDFYLHLLANGVLIPGTRRAFLSAAHAPAIVDTLAAAIERSLDACREDGLL